MKKESIEHIRKRIGWYNETRDINIVIRIKNLKGDILNSLSCNVKANSRNSLIGEIWSILEKHLRIHIFQHFVRYIDNNKKSMHITIRENTRYNQPIVIQTRLQ